MPVEPLEIPVGGGLDQRSIDKKIEPPALLVAEDCRTDKRGGLAKRYGYLNKTVLGDSTIETGGATYVLPEDESPPSTAATCALTPGTIFEHSGQICHMTPQGVMVYDDQADKWTVPTSNSLYHIDARTKPLIVVDQVACNPSMVRLGNLLFVAWQETAAANSFFAVFDATTYEMVRGPQSIANINYAPRLVAFDTTWIALVGNDTDPEATTASVYGSTYNTTAGTYAFGAAVSLQSSGDKFDVHGDINAAVYAGIFVAGTGVTVRTMDKSGPTAAFVTVVSSSALGVYYDTANDQIYFSLQNAGTGDIRWYKYPPSLSGGTTGVLLASASKPTWFSTTRARIRPQGQTEILWCYSTHEGRYSGTVGASVLAWGIHVIRTSLTPAVLEHHLFPGTSMHGTPVVPSSGPCGAMFGVSNVFQQRYAGDVAAAVGTAGQAYPALCLATAGINAADEHELLTLARVMANPTHFDTAPPSSDSQTFDDHRHVADMLLGVDGELLGAFTNTLDTSENDPGAFTHRSRIVLLSAKTGTDAAERTVLDTQMGRIASAGVVGIYDGLRGAAQASEGQPVLLDFTRTAGVGTTPTSGTVIAFSIVLTWTDAYGRIHRSPPSNTLSRNVGASTSEAGGTLSFTLPWRSVNGDLGNDTQVEIYATDVVDAVDNSAGTRKLELVAHGPTRVVGDAPLWVTPEFTWFMTSRLGAAEYVQAGELSSDPTTAPRDVAVSADRVFYLDGFGEKVYATKPHTAESFSWEFNEANFVLIPQEGGEAHAIEVMDDKLVVFKARRIYVLSVASGPDRNGAGGFQIMRQVPTDSGTTRPQSVVLTPTGVLFQGDAGLYLLDRTLRVTFVGGAVRDETDGFSVTSANVLRRDSEVRLHLDSSGAHTDRKLVIWNYEHDVWTTHTLMPSVSAWPGDDYLVLDTDMVVSTEDTGSYLHANSAVEIAPSEQTAWLNLAGIDGFQRVKRVLVGGTHSTGDVRVRLFFDYSATHTDEWYFREGDLTMNTTLRLKPSVQKCKAISVEVTLVAVGGTTTKGSGFLLDGITLEVLRDRTIGSRTVGDTFTTTNPR